MSEKKGRCAHIPARTGLLLIEPEHLSRVEIGKSTPGVWEGRAIFAVFTSENPQEVALTPTGNPMFVVVELEGGSLEQLYSMEKIEWAAQEANKRFGLVADAG